MTEELASTSFAKKYRPLLLKDLIGQDNAKKQISGILKSGRIPCAMLLTGATGCGKTTIARVIARHINKVKECTPVNDIYEFNIGTNGTMEDIRKLVESAKFLPMDSKHKKIYILDEVHKLTKASASGLLKEIEEPPAHVLYLLCTNEPDKLLDTLVNRCEKINLQPYSEGDITKLLKYVCEQENIKIQEKYLQKIAEMGNCQPRECLVSLQAIANLLAGGKEVSEAQMEEQIQKAIKNNIYEYANGFLLALYLKNYAGAIKRLDECGDSGGLLALAANTNRSIVKYIAGLSSNGTYQASCPYGARTMLGILKEKAKNMDIAEMVRRSNRIHQVLIEAQTISRSVTVDVGDVLLTKIGIYCFES